MGWVFIGTGISKFSPLEARLKIVAALWRKVTTVCPRDKLLQRNTTVSLNNHVVDSCLGEGGLESPRLILCLFRHISVINIL